MNLQTVKQNMLYYLKGIERSEITEAQVEAVLRANFFEPLMKGEDEQKMAEYFQEGLNQNGTIKSQPIGSIQVGFFEISFHENYADPDSVDYVYTYEIHKNEWPGIN